MCAPSQTGCVDAMVVVRKKNFTEGALRASCERCCRSDGGREPVSPGFARVRTGPEPKHA